MGRFTLRAWRDYLTSQGLRSRSFTLDLWRHVSGDRRFSVERFLELISGQPSSGGGTPYAASIDFKNGIYTLNGVAKTRSEMVVENTDWATFDPSKIIPGTGYQISRMVAGNSSDGFVLTDAVSAGILPAGSGITMVATYSIVCADPVPDTYARGALHIEALDLPDYAQEWDVALDFINSVGNISTLHDFSNPDAPITAGAGTSHKAAFTFGPDRVAASIDGNAVASINPAADNSGATHIGVRISAGLFDDLAISVVTTLEKIELIAIVADAGLPALGAP